MLKLIKHAKKPDGLIENRKKWIVRNGVAHNSVKNSWLLRLWKVFGKKCVEKGVWKKVCGKSCVEKGVCVWKRIFVRNPVFAVTSAPVCQTQRLTDSITTFAPKPPISHLAQKALICTFHLIWMISRQHTTQIVRNVHFCCLGHSFSSRNLFQQIILSFNQYAIILKTWFFFINLNFIEGWLWEGNLLILKFSEGWVWVQTFQIILFS